MKQTARYGVILLLSLVAWLLAAARTGATVPLHSSAWLFSYYGAGERRLDQGDKPAEQAFTNIQVLKGLPGSQLMTVMHFIRTSLGVRCDYCHVAENGKYGLDDKPAKQIARRMIQMVFDINREKFGGRTVVTCNTCHQGQTQPPPVPSIGQGAFPNTTRADGDGKSVMPLPTVDEVFDRYVQAIGGKEAVSKITTRVMSLTLLRPKLIDGDTVNAHMLARGETWRAEVYQKAPDKYLIVTTTPDEVIQQGFNGTVGWVQSPNGRRQMSAAEVVRFKRRADFFAEINRQQQYSKLAVAGIVKIDGREAYRIEALNADNKTEQLFFDTQNGLLIRRIVLTPTALGPDPEQTDYADYREVNGIRLPLTVKVSYLDDSHLGTTQKIIEIRQNVPLEDARFEMPTKP